MSTDMPERNSNDLSSAKSGKVATAIWLVISQILAVGAAVLVRGGLVVFLVFGGANCPECLKGFDGAFEACLLALLVCIPGSWILFAIRKYCIANLVSALPLAMAIVIAVSMVADSL